MTILPPRRLLLLASLLILPLFFCGCSENSPRSTTLSQVRVISGNAQSTLPGTEYPDRVILELLGPANNSIFSGRSSPPPAVGIKLKLVPAPGSTLTAIPDTVESDEGGCAVFHVKAGRRTGDNYLDVVPEGADGPALRLRFLVGARFTGGDQEGRTDSVLEKPLSIKLVKPDGTPAENVPVYFTPVASPDPDSPAKVTHPMANTNSEGVAETTVKLGSATGEYRVGVEAADPGSGYFIRFKPLRLLGLSVVSVTIAVIGGLAFFIYGMKMMGDGLLKIAGENMKKVLQFFSRNRVVAVSAGTAVTAIIQSSAATTIMVIGFLNAGLLTLKQGIGIIFGANIGTTVTAQLIAFNLSTVALPCVALGFAVMALAKRRVWRGWGETVLGFGLLFFGMTMMSDELKLLGTFPTFVNFFSMFDCRPGANGLMPFGATLGAIFIGIAVTIAIQSSSAATGVVLALAAGGLVNFYTAIPLLLGSNIGTTVTAIIAAITANRVAKQAALAHFLFNVFGVLVMVGLFYVPYKGVPCFLYFINWITPGNVFASIPQDIERHIAMAHTFFNVFTVAMLMPFLGPFTRLCEILLPVRDAEGAKTTMLEPHLLAQPSVALEQVVGALRNMVSESWSMVDLAVNRHFVTANVDPEAFHELDEKEKHIDDTQAEITNYLVEITRRELTHHQSAIIPLLMHCTNDAEKIADHTENILKLTKRLAKTGIKLSDVARNDLNTLWALVNDQAMNVIQALSSSSDNKSVQSALDSEKRINKLAKKYEKNYTRKKDELTVRTEVYEAENEVPVDEDDRLANITLENEREINDLTRQFEQQHVDRRNTGLCSVETSVIFVEMLWELEKLGDHLANIAIRTPEIQKHYFQI